MIVGVDEVGRGCWAGPLCVGAVVLGNNTIDGLTDSKLLSAKRREALAAEIRLHAKAIGIGWVSARAIDDHGISMALKVATKQTIAQIQATFDEIIIDGTVNFIGDPRVTTLAKADKLVPSVSAASIIAKVARDHYMHRVHDYFSQYHFHKHVGYGTALHKQMLDEHGPSPLHRMSFAPMKAMTPSVSKKPLAIPTSGKLAETHAAAFLQSNGYEVIAQNWRTRWCEIDIIAQKNNTIYFVEVKYRAGLAQGSGLEYITPQKVAQMKFAAAFWVHKCQWPGDYRLAALEVSGKDFAISAWLDTV